MAKYRKKPVVIEAVQWTGRQITWPAWFLEAEQAGVIQLAGDALQIITLEGPLRASIGDWVIRGVKGELYPCKPDIFEATYEPVTGT